MGTIYRRPGSDPVDFNNKLNDILSIITRERKRCIHAGDYNLNLLNASTHPPTSEFTDINFSHSLFPVINKPTRITSTSATLIDNIFTPPSDMNNSTCGLLLWDISDHLPIFFIHYNDIPSEKQAYRIGRSHSEKNRNFFSTQIKDTDWSSVTSINDTQVAYSRFHEIITQVYNESFPIVKTKIGYINKLPWLTASLKSSIKRKHKLHITYLKNPTSKNKFDYLKYKNKLTHILKVTERRHIQSELNAYKNNMRKSWKVIKDIINKNSKNPRKLPKITINGTLCDDPQAIAEAFNKYFTNIGPTLDRKIPASETNPLDFLPSNYTVNLFLTPATDLEINKIVDNLKNCSVGWDQLPSSIFKENKDPLSNILNTL